MSYNTDLQSNNDELADILQAVNELPEASVEPVGNYIPVPSVAEVGQTIVVTAVNEKGVPTAWEAADLPSGGEEWVLLEHTTLTEDITLYEKTFDNPQKKIIGMIKPGVAVNGWKYISNQPNGAYAYPIGNFALTATEYLVIHIADDSLTGLRCVDFYASESLPQNGMNNAAKRGSGVFHIGDGAGYMAKQIERFSIKTSALLVQGAEILILGVRA